MAAFHYAKLCTADNRRKLTGTKDGALPFAQQHHRELGAIGPSGSESTDNHNDTGLHFFFIQTGQRTTIAASLVSSAGCAAILCLTERPLIRACHNSPTTRHNSPQPATACSQIPEVPVVAPQPTITHLASLRLCHNPPQPTHEIHSPNCYLIVAPQLTTTYHNSDSPQLTTTLTHHNSPLAQLTTMPHPPS